MAAFPQPTWPPRTEADLDAAAQSQGLKPQIAASPASLFGGALTDQLLDYLPIAGSLLPILAAVKMRKAPRPWDSARGLKDFLEDVQGEMAKIPEVSKELRSFAQQAALQKTLAKRGIDATGEALRKETKDLQEATLKWTRSARTEKRLVKEPGVQSFVSQLKTTAPQPAANVFEVFGKLGKPRK